MHLISYNEHNIKLQRSQACNYRIWDILQRSQACNYRIWDILLQTVQIWLKIDRHIFDLAKTFFMCSI